MNLLSLLPKETVEKLVITALKAYLFPAMDKAAAATPTEFDDKLLDKAKTLLLIAASLIDGH